MALSKTLTLVNNVSNLQLFVQAIIFKTIILKLKETGTINFSGVQLRFWWGPFVSV